MQLWAQAALADNVDAQVEYAIALYNGDGIDRNQQAAAAIFRKAALHGSPIAQDRLARILSTGQGAPARSGPGGEMAPRLSAPAARPNLELDDYMSQARPATRAAGEKAAKPWLEAIKPGQTRP